MIRAWQWLLISPGALKKDNRILTFHMTVRMKINPWLLYFFHAEYFLQLIMKQGPSMACFACTLSPGRARLAFLVCFFLSLSLLLFLLSVGLLTFCYLSTCPSPSPALKNAHNESALLFLLTLRLGNKAVHLNNAHWFWPWAVFKSLILLFPHAVPPVTSSLLSPSYLLSKVFSYFVFPELLIMQAGGSISSL